MCDLHRAGKKQSRHSAPCGRAWATAIALQLLAALLLGCKGGAAVTVDISVPRPLVEPIDATVGVYFNPQLKNYVHQEELDDHGAYSIDIGASQAPVFAQVFDAMFSSVVRVDPDEQPADQADQASLSFSDASGGIPGMDGILSPSIEEVQFAIPDQTGGEFYEVWIRYRMRLFDADGLVLAEWPLIGYGKANERNYGTIDQKSAGLNAATIWALRDAAALLSFGFRNQVEVQDWLGQLGAAPP